MTEMTEEEKRERQRYNEALIAEFRKSGGKVGGRYEGRPLILVHHKGARTGIERVTPLVYLEDNGRIFVFASKGGADTNPDWYHNLVANPRTKVEVGTETLDVQARVLTGPERDEIFAKQVKAMPHFGDYQKKTTRVIPVVEFVRV